MVGIQLALVKLSKKGMISIPAELRKKFNLKAGDELVIMEGSEGLIIVPVLPLESLIDEKQAESTKRLIRELEEERRREANQE